MLTSCAGFGSLVASGGMAVWRALATPQRFGTESETLGTESGQGDLVFRNGHKFLSAPLVLGAGKLSAVSSHDFFGLNEAA
jgi:hypothetical protein